MSIAACLAQAVIIVVDFGTPPEMVSRYDGKTLGDLRVELHDHMQTGLLRWYCTQPQPTWHHGVFLNTVLKIGVGSGADWLAPVQFYEILEPSGQEIDILHETYDTVDNTYYILHGDTT